MEQSTIKLSKKLKNDLRKQMNHPRETYEAVIARLLKITQDDVLSGEVIKNIEEGVAEGNMTMQEKMAEKEKKRTEAMKDIQEKVKEELNKKGYK